ncbi:MAG: SH3 domain-containing protein [Geminicoccaceae bacterium]
MVDVKGRDPKMKALISATAIVALLGATACDPATVQQLAGTIANDVSAQIAGVKTPGSPPLGVQTGLTGRVSKGANLRSGPGTSHQRAGQAAAGRPLAVLAREDNWYQVAFVDGQQPAAGWLRADLIELSIVGTEPRAAEAVASVNLRAAPRDGAAVIGSIAKNSKVAVIGAEGGWLKIRDGDREGWASGQYVVADLQTSVMAAVPGAGTGTEATTPVTSADPADPGSWNLKEGAIQPLETRIETAGYTAAFRGVRAMTRNGAFELALDELKRMAEPPVEVEPAAGSDDSSIVQASKPTDGGSGEDGQGFFGQDKLHLTVERGALLLEKGELEAAVAAFEEAETELETRNSRSQFEDLLVGAASVFGGAASGDGEFGPYNLQPYEEILFLNYKTIGYLLQGRREAYNVGRRAADRQNELRDEFQELIEEVKGKPVEPEGEADAEADGQIAKVNHWLQEIGERYSDTGDRVPSAYVNPFGFYVVGMVNEIESYTDPSQRDNARIAYEKALELNPSSPVLKDAARAMGKSFARSDRKVVHFLGSIGMAPEKRVASFGLPIARLNTVMPLKFPVYQEVRDTVAKIEVRDTTGQRVLGQLTPLADIEAMVVRYQKDRLPAETSRFLLGLYPRLMERGLLSEFGSIGEVIANWRETTINPDMRAWLALPAVFHAARLELPRQANRVQIRSFDAKGRELGRETVELPGDNHGFAYVRAVDKVLTAQAGEASWAEQN